MTQRPFSARMFPFTALVVARSYAQGATGSPKPSEPAGVSMACNLMMAADDKFERQYPDQGDAVGDVKTMQVTFPTDPGVVAEDTVTPEAPSPFAGITFICNGPAVPVLRGAGWRVRGLART